MTKARLNDNVHRAFLVLPYKICGLLIYLGGSPKPRQDVDQQPSNYCPSTVRLR